MGRSFIRAVYGFSTVNHRGLKYQSISRVRLTTASALSRSRGLVVSAREYSQQGGKHESTQKPRARILCNPRLVCRRRWSRQLWHRYRERRPPTLWLPRLCQRSQFRKTIPELAFFCTLRFCQCLNSYDSYCTCAQICRYVCTCRTLGPGFSECP